MIGRRGFITGLISLAAAPAIVRAGSLMPVKVMLPDTKRLITSKLAAGRSMTVEEYIEMVMGPRIREMQRLVADQIMYGNPRLRLDGLTLLTTDWPR